MNYFHKKKSSTKSLYLERKKLLVALSNRAMRTGTAELQVKVKVPLIGQTRQKQRIELEKCWSTNKRQRGKVDWCELQALG